MNLNKTQVKRQYHFKKRLLMRLKQKEKYVCLRYCNLSEWVSAFKLTKLQYKTSLLFLRARHDDDKLFLALETWLINGSHYLNEPRTS